MFDRDRAIEGGYLFTAGAILLTLILYVANIPFADAQNAPVVPAQQITLQYTPILKRVSGAVMAPTDLKALEIHYAVDDGTRTPHMVTPAVAGELKVPLNLKPGAHVFEAWGWAIDTNGLKSPEAAYVKYEFTVPADPPAGVTFEISCSFATGTCSGKVVAPR
jgi:hypothetical protein